MKNMTIEELKSKMQKVVLMTKDKPMADEMEFLLDNGGRELLASDELFREELIQNILTHENQYVVIYEDYQMAARFFDLYNLLV